VFDCAAFDLAATSTEQWATVGTKSATEMMCTRKSEMMKRKMIKMTRMVVMGLTLVIETNRLVHQYHTMMLRKRKCMKNAAKKTKGDVDKLHAVGVLVERSADVVVPAAVVQYAVAADATPTSTLASSPPSLPRVARSEGDRRSGAARPR
jgi:hypothetical protein